MLTVLIVFSISWTVLKPSGEFWNRVKTLYYHIIWIWRNCINLVWMLFKVKLGKLGIFKIIVLIIHTNNFWIATLACYRFFLGLWGLRKASTLFREDTEVNPQQVPRVVFLWKIMMMRAMKMMWSQLSASPPRGVLSEHCSLLSNLCATPLPLSLLLPTLYPPLTHVCTPFYYSLQCTTLLPISLFRIHLKIHRFSDALALWPRFLPSLPSGKQVLQRLKSAGPFLKDFPLKYHS